MLVMKKMSTIVSVDVIKAMKMSAINSDVISVNVIT